MLPLAWLRGSTCREFTCCSVKGSDWLVEGNITAECIYIFINSAEIWDQGILKRPLGHFMLATIGRDNRT